VIVPVGRDAAESATWGEAEGGRSLAVTPTAWGRAGGMTVMAYGWPSVVALAPDVDTGADPAANTGTRVDADADAEGVRDSMRKQFRCHALGAPHKATWNLEPWRPNVSFAEFVAARCNPN